MKTCGYYRKNAKVTIYRGGKKELEGYSVGVASPKFMQKKAENNKLVPVGMKGSDNYYEGSGEEGRPTNYSGDQFVASEKRDEPKRPSVS